MGIELNCQYEWMDSQMEFVCISLCDVFAGHRCKGGKSCKAYEK